MNETKADKSDTAKKTDQEKLNEFYGELWIQAEKILADPQRLGYTPENSRISGLINAHNRRWEACLLRLNEALGFGINDLQTLDTFGEAAYQAGTPEALLPFAGLYKDPFVAIHMARALMLLGDVETAEQYALQANDSILKTSILSMLGVKDSIQTAMASMLDHDFDEPQNTDKLQRNTPEWQESLKKLGNLNYPEFWQALSVIADAARKEALVKLGEMRSKALSYKNPVIHFNQSIRLLARGEFRAAWKLYDWRLVPGSPCPLPTAFGEIPMWEGEFLKGKTLAVVLENGLGDQMFALRFIRPLLVETKFIEIVVGDALFELVKSSFPDLRVHREFEARDPQYWAGKNQPDYWTYALSIPARSDHWAPVPGFNTCAYLKAPFHLVERYSKQLQQCNPKHLPVHGIVWHGDIRTAAMRTRAYSVEEFLQVSNILSKPCVLVNLQLDITSEEKKLLAQACIEKNSLFLDASETLIDFAHTAAWIYLLDHMYSCDTSCAHAAGGLGQSSTVFIRNTSIWHWIVRENSAKEGYAGKSVWYDSVQVKHALVPEISYMFEIREDVKKSKPATQTPGAHL